MTTYRIVRRFFNDEVGPKVLATGLTLEEAREYCRDPETSSRTCMDHDNIARTEQLGPWFDGYDEE